MNVCCFGVLRMSDAGPCPHPAWVTQQVVIGAVRWLRSGVASWIRILLRFWPVESDYALGKLLLLQAFWLLIYFLTARIWLPLEPGRYMFTLFPLQHVINDSLTWAGTKCLYTSATWQVRMVILIDCARIPWNNQGEQLILLLVQVPGKRGFLQGAGSSQKQNQHRRSIYPFLIRTTWPSHQTGNTLPKLPWFKAIVKTPNPYC